MVTVVDNFFFCSYALCAVLITLSAASSILKTLPAASAITTVSSVRKLKDGVPIDTIKDVAAIVNPVIIFFIIILYPLPAV